MRKDYRIMRAGHHVETGTPTGVRAARHHPNSLHLVHDGTTKFRQTFILRIVTAGTHQIASIIGHQHPAHTQIVVHGYKAELIPDRASAFDIKCNSEFAFPHCLLEIGTASLYAM